MKIFVITLILFLETTVYARELQFSVIGLYNQSRIEFESVSQNSQNSNTQYFSGDTTSYGSYSLGVLIERPLKNLWSLELGLIYLNRGYVSKTTFQSYSGTTETKNTFYWKNIHMPFVGRFRPTKVFTGIIGCFVNFGVDKITSESETQGRPTVKATQSFADAGFNTLDYGITYGAGLNIEVSPALDLLIELRFNEGIANILANPTTVTTSGYSTETTQNKATSRDIMLLLGFTI